jgi:hypothetical protein
VIAGRWRYEGSWCGAFVTVPVAAGVAVGDRVAGGVAVSVELLRRGDFEDGVEGREPAEARVVLAVADVGSAGGIRGVVEEGFVGRAGLGRVPLAAEGVESAVGEGDRVDSGVATAVRVGDCPVRSSMGSVNVAADETSRTMCSRLWQVDLATPE